MEKNKNALKMNIGLSQISKENEVRISVLTVFTIANK